MENTWEDIKLLVLDFDGVLTDGFVYVDQNGKETVRCSRRDSLGIENIGKQGVETLVISKETNGVVAMRCKKMGIECYSGIDDKLSLLKKVLKDKAIDSEHACYVGDDVTDISCIQHVGIGVTLANGVRSAKDAADYVTDAKGGDHAVREVCDLIGNTKKKS